VTQTTRIALVSVLLLPLIACNAILSHEQTNVQAYLEQGGSRLAKGQYEEAIAAYTEALKLDSDLAEAYDSRGYAYSMMGEYEQALADLNRAIELDPDCARAYNNRGFIYAEQGKYEQAIADYNKDIELDQSDEHVDYTYNDRGFAYGKLGEYDLAFQDFERAATLNDQNAWLYYNRALILIDMGEETRALDDLELSLILDNPPLDQKRRENAIQLLSKLRNNDSEAKIPRCKRRPICIVSDQPKLWSQGESLPPAPLPNRT